MSLIRAITLTRSFVPRMEGFPARAYFPFAFLVILCLCGCTLPQNYQVHDLGSMPQQPAEYLDSASANTPLMNRSEQHRLMQDFLARHFSPWRADAPLKETQHPFWALEWLESNEAFGHNLLPMESEAVANLEQRCAAKAYPSMQRHAISVAHTDVRALPTPAPIFNDPAQAGEGFPFDYMQHGVLPAGSPLLVTHASQSGNWLFIETPLLYGWVPATAVAWVDNGFKDAYSCAEYIAFVEDGHPLHSAAGGSFPPTRAGTIVPLLEHTDSGYVVGVPHKNSQGDAALERAIVSSAIGHPFPLPLTPARVAELSSHFMNQPYSWGDRFSGRDCSGTMRDLFAPFGIWLPRNSGDQTNVGRAISLNETPLPQRRDYIATHAIPFATLLHVPGHIMLYIGEHEGKAAVLHTVWGIRAQPLLGDEKRIKIGETAITSLEPGKELNEIWRRISSLLERLDQMNILHQQSPE
ncbi:MAG: SH3 domain-containing protein [Desulfuromonadaceae bacterium]